MPWNKDGGFTYGPGDEAALARMNAVRAKMGLPPLAMGDTVSLEDINAARTSGFNPPRPGEPDTEQPLDKNAQTPAQAETTRHGNEPWRAIGNALTPKQIAAGAPGSTLDTANADEERAQLGGLLAQLQQQAATGGGEWEKTLADATRRSQQTAMALGQSIQNQTGGNYGTALQNIGAAQSAAGQRAVGQGNILRAQAQQGAQGQLEGLLGGMGEQDVEQARLAANARQQRREANAELVKQARERSEATLGKIGQAAMAASRGGRVPGRPRVFGDDSSNDTVPALLSPNEIVVPISAAQDPDKAAAFARAVALRRPKHLADGGDTGLENVPGPNKDESLQIAFVPHIGLANYYNRIGAGPQGPDWLNGGMLDTGQFETGRAAALGLASQLQGPGATVAPQQLTTAQDDTVSSAMEATQRQARSGAANALTAAIAGQQRRGGEAAATSGNEQARRLALLGHVLQGQRGRDLAMALAQQQAGWRNTALNAGLSAANQAEVMNALGGGAQAAAALAHAGAGGRQRTDSYGLDERGERGGPADLGRGGQFSDEEDHPRGDYSSSSSGSQHAAHGGLVMEPDERERLHRFLKKLRKAA